MPRVRRERLTVTGAPAREGVVACTNVATATSAAVLRAFVEQVPAPALRGGRPGRL